MRSRSRGFTLVELLIAMVVVAILSAIAIPSYRAYVQRSKRSEATTTLMQIQASQEKFFLQNNAYVTTTANLSAAPPAGLGIPATTNDGNYDLTLAAAAPGGYTATATATSTQADDAKCQTFTINQNGVRTATGSASNPTVECWK